MTFSACGSLIRWTQYVQDFSCHQISPGPGRHISAWHSYPVPFPEELLHLHPAGGAKNASSARCRNVTSGFLVYHLMWVKQCHLHHPPVYHKNAYIYIYNYNYMWYKLTIPSHGW